MRALFERKVLGLKEGTSGEPGFSDLLAYDTVVGDGVVLLKTAVPGHSDGGLLAGFWYEGPDVESASDAKLEGLSEGMNQALKRLDGGWMLHVEAVRVAVHSYEASEFVESVDTLIEEEREQGADHYVTQCALFLTQMPRVLETDRGKKLMRFALGTSPGDELEGLEGRIARFEAKAQEFEQVLSAHVRVQRMRSRPENDELLQALNLMVNGRWLPACRAPRADAELSAILARDLVWTPNETTHGDDLVNVIALRDLPNKSTPCLLRVLTTLGADLRWSSRFILEDYGGAQSKLKSLSSNWEKKLMPFLSVVLKSSGHVNRDAAERVDEMQEALADLESGVIRYGHYTSVVVVRAGSREALKRKTDAVVSALEGSGFVPVVETYNRLDALLGSFPGHGTENVRRPLIHSLNFADLLPLGAEWEGARACPSPMFPRQSPALMQVRTWGGSPFFLNLHHGDVGHTLILGPTGAGKSTLLAHLATQFLRYPQGQVFVLDQGASMAALALGRQDGAFYGLGVEGGLRLCPLADIDSETDRAWAADWLEMLCECQGLALTPTVRARMFEAVGELAEVTAGAANRAAKRSLTMFMPHLSDLPTVLAALSYYTTGPGSQVLDGDSDALRRARFTTFELEKLLELDPKVVRPTLLYLFRQIEKRLDGRPTLLIVDEAWRQLSDAAFAGRVRSWLKTWRRKNCAVVLATQQLSDVANSPIGEVVFESCFTRILLPNDRATQSMRKLYAECLGLSDAQIQLLAAAERKRWYLYTASSRSRLFTLDVGPVAASFCAASAPHELERIWSLVRTHGVRWPYVWLQERGLAAAAERFVELEIQRARRARSAA